MQRYFILGKELNNYIIYDIQSGKIAIIDSSNPEKNTKQFKGLGFDFYIGSYIGDSGRKIENCSGVLVSYDFKKDIYGVAQYNSKHKTVGIKYFVDTDIDDMRNNLVANSNTFDNVAHADEMGIDITSVYCRIYKRFPCSSSNILSRERYIKWLEDKNREIELSISNNSYGKKESELSNKREKEVGIDTVNKESKDDEKVEHTKSNSSYMDIEKVVFYERVLREMQPDDTISIPIDVYRNYRALAIRNLETTMDMSEYTSLIKIRFRKDDNTHIVGICKFSDSSDFVRFTKSQTMSKYEITDTEVNNIVNKYKEWKKTFI